MLVVEDTEGWSERFDELVPRGKYMLGVRDSGESREFRIAGFSTSIRCETGAPVVLVWANGEETRVAEVEHAGVKRWDVRNRDGSTETVRAAGYLERVVCGSGGMTRDQYDRMSGGRRADDFDFQGWM